MSRIWKPKFNTPLDPKKCDGLVAFYDATTQGGGNVLYDRFGNRNGDLYNSPSWAEDSSIKCNGVNNCVRIDNSVSNLSDFTIILNCDTTKLIQGESQHIFGVSSDGSTDGFAFRYYTHERLKFDVIGVTGWRTYEVPPVFSKNTLIALKYKNSEITIFVNERQDSTIATINSTVARKIALGGMWVDSLSNDYLSDPSALIIHNTYTYNHALSDSEILAHQDPYYLYRQPKIFPVLIESSGLIEITGSHSPSYSHSGAIDLSIEITGNHSPEYSHSGNIEQIIEVTGDHSPVYSHTGAIYLLVEITGDHSPEYNHSGSVEQIIEITGNHSPEYSHSGFIDLLIEVTGNHSPEYNHSGSLVVFNTIEITGSHSPVYSHSGSIVFMGLTITPITKNCVLPEPIERSCVFPELSIQSAFPEALEIDCEL